MKDMVLPVNGRFLIYFWIFLKRKGKTMWLKMIIEKIGYFYTGSLINQCITSNLIKKNKININIIHFGGDSDKLMVFVGI